MAQDPKTLTAEEREVLLEHLEKWESDMALSRAVGYDWFAVSHDSMPLSDGIILVKAWRIALGKEEG